jgi:PilZ domain
MLVRPSFQPQRAIVRDVSRRSIGLYVACGLPVGSRLALQLRGTDRGDGSILCANVVQSVGRSEGWTVGCELSRPLSDSELASLR